MSGISLSSDPLILGHRGAPAEIPENTLASFRLAVEQGADGVELDVQLSADGVPVVIHDDTLERTTRGHGAVAALPWAALQTLEILPIGDAPQSGGGERIPSLEEVARWGAEAGVWLNVEIKSPQAAAAALEVLREANVLERSILSSFYPDVVAEVGQLAPQVRRYLLTEQWNGDVREALLACGAGGVCLEEKIATTDVLHECAERNLPVIVWTVDAPLALETLLQSGVAGIITNHPARGVAAKERTTRE